MIEIGHFSNGDKELFKLLLNSLTGYDPFFVMADFEDYLNKQDEVSECWNNKKSWNKMALLNTARLDISLQIGLLENTVKQSGKFPNACRDYLRCGRIN